MGVVVAVPQGEPEGERERGAEPEPVEEWEGERVLAPLLVVEGQPLGLMVSVGV